MTTDSLRALLPWDHPFRMIDRLVEHVPHRTIVTTKTVSAGDAMIAGRIADQNSQLTCDDGTSRDAGAFVPEPGGALARAMLLEGMGQSASLLYTLSYGKGPASGVPLLGYVKTTFHAGARAGDTITYEVRAVKMTSTMGLFEATARVDRTLLAEAEFALGVAGSGPVSEEPSPVEDAP